MVIKIIVGLLVLSFIVVIHELGHFIFAKRAGIRVEEFCIGLGPRVIGKKVGETIYSIRAFPIGGACMMTGEDSDVTNDEKSFQNKSLWQRILVVAGGPLFNFILAFVVALILVWSTGVNLPRIDAVVENGPAAKAGLQAGDKIVKLDDKKIITFDDIRLKLFNEGQKTYNIEYEREGKIVNTTINPELVDNIPTLGVSKQATKDRVGIVSGIRYAAHEVRYWVDSVFVGLKKIFTGKVSAKEVSGPVGIVNLIGSSVEKSASGGLGAVFQSLGFFIVLISANLGVMNLLPFPALDGGRLVFLFLELIRGKRINPKFEGAVNLVGFALLMLLMVFMVYNDAINLIR